MPAGCAAPHCQPRPQRTMLRFDAGRIAHRISAYRRWRAQRRAGSGSRAPPNMRYEHALTLAHGAHVIAHGRFSNIGLTKNRIAADIVRIADGVLAEHWDVL